MKELAVRQVQNAVQVLIAESLERNLKVPTVLYALARSTTDDVSTLYVQSSYRHRVEDGLVDLLTGFGLTKDGEPNFYGLVVQAAIDAWSALLISSTYSSDSLRDELP